MDTVGSRELVRLFKRVNGYVDLQGCQTPEEVYQKVRECLALMQNAVDSAQRPSTRWKWLAKMKFLWTMIKEDSKPKSIRTTKIKHELGVSNRRVGFQTAVIEEAINNPDGYINRCFDDGVKLTEKKMRLEPKRKNCLSIHRNRLGKTTKNTRRQFQ